MSLRDSIRFYAATDVGKVRDHNEDNFLVDKKLALFVVAVVGAIAVARGRHTNEGPSEAATKAPEAP